MSLLSRFLPRTSTAVQLSRALANARAFNDAEPFDWEWDVRSDRYAFNTAMLLNLAYEGQAAGGFRETILQETFGITDTDGTLLRGMVNPVRAIVDAYQNVFRGTFGKEIKVAEEVDGQPVNPELLRPDGPVRNLWRWSNLDTAKGVMQEWAANLGTVGIRVRAQSNDDPAKRRVFLQFDHPGKIVDFDEDERGNVVEIRLEYQAIAGELGSKRRDVKVVEVLGKDRFYKEVNGQNVLEPDQRVNALGVCPYVLLRHRDTGGEFGRWAYEGSESIVHGINWIASNQSESIVEHVWPTWFATAGGPRPDTFKYGRQEVAYVSTKPDSPPPSMEPLVAPLNQADARMMWVELVNHLQARQPEMVLTNIPALSGQSGETIAQLKSGAAERIEQAKANYEHALTRALQIGLSEGVRMGLWDLGTGKGTAEAAERAYGEGREDFAFNDRPALPQSVFDKQQQVKLNDAEAVSKFNLAKAAQPFVDDLEALRLAGYSDAEANAIAKRKNQQRDAEAARTAKQQPAAPPAK